MLWSRRWFIGNGTEREWISRVGFEEFSAQNNHRFEITVVLVLVRPQETLCPEMILLQQFKKQLVLNGRSLLVTTAHLPEEGRNVQHDTVADDVRAILVDHAAGQKMERKLLPFHLRNGRR